MKKLILFICAFLLIPAVNSFPQDKTLFEQLKENFKKKYFNVGVLFKSLADFQVERSQPGNNGFSVINFRLKVSGDLDEGFGYYLQTEFTRSPSLLDAFLYYKISENFRVDIGQYKAPFSTEQLLSESALPFVNRARATAMFPPGRQIGLQLKATTSTVEVSTGIFNGNGTESRNDNQNFMYAGQVIVSPIKEEKYKLIITGNAAFSNDATSSFKGDRILFGGDIAIVLNKFQLNSEFVHQKSSSGIILNEYGYHITGAFYITEKIQMLARWDYIKLEGDGDFDDKLVILGCNIWPTEVVKFQINYLVDDSKFKDDQLLIVSQLAF